MHPMVLALPKLLNHVPFGFNFSLRRRQNIRGMHDQAAAFPIVPISSLTCVLAYWPIS